MTNLKKRALTILVALVLVIGLVPGMTVSAIDSGEISGKLASLQSTYYNGYDGSSGLLNGTQCWGWANFVFNNLFGRIYNGSDCTVHRDVNRLKVGDYIRSRWSYSSYYEKWVQHSLVITGFSGDTVIYTDRNGSGSDTVQWGRTISKSELQSRLNAPITSNEFGSNDMTFGGGYGYIVSYNGNTSAPGGGSSAPPDQPILSVNTHAVTYGGGEVQFSWGQCSGADWYDLLICDESGAEVKVFPQISDTAIGTTLLPGYYTAKVCAVSDVPRQVVFSDIIGVSTGVGSRSVSGDFNGDGLDDCATFYDMGNGTAQMQVFLSRGDSFSEHIWWEELRENWIGAWCLSGTMVAGDFNGDGIDDIAGLYDYGDGKMRMLVWLSQEDHFVMQDWNNNYMQTNNTYSVKNVKDNVVSGDFNGDGKDDIGALYSYDGGENMGIHVFLSTGSSFNNYSTWFWTYGQSTFLCSGRIVTGNFNGDAYDDIAAIFSYDGGKNIGIRVYESTGSNFKNNSVTENVWLWNYEYSTPYVTGRVASGDFNGDGYDDISACYDYGSNQMGTHIFFNTKDNHFASWVTWRWETQYNPSNITSRTLSGDFDGNGYSDITRIYNYGNNIAFHALMSTGEKFNDVWLKQLNDYYGERTQGWYTSYGRHNIAFPVNKSYDLSNGSYKIRHLDSGKYINIEQTGTMEGLKFMLWARNDISGQSFYFERLSDDTYKIISSAGGKALTVNSDASERIYQSDFTNNDAQKWYIVRVGESFKIVNKHSGKSLNVSDNSSTNGAYILHHNNDNSYAQRFQLIALYPIIYDTNNGINAPAEQAKMQGENLTLRFAIPTRPGYTFLGWATSADATIPEYQPGGSYTAEESVTLYAVWQQNASLSDYELKIVQNTLTWDGSVIQGTLQVNLIKNISATQRGRVAVSVYNDIGQLVYVKFSDYTDLDIGNNLLPAFSINLPNMTADSYTVKAMAWGAARIEPLATAALLPL